MDTTNGNGKTHAKPPLSEEFKSIFEKTVLPGVADFAGVIDQLKLLINAVGELAIIDLVNQAEAKLKPILDALHKSEEESILRKAKLIKDLTGLEYISEDSAMTICGHYDEAKWSKSEILRSFMEQLLPLAERYLVHQAHQSAGKEVAV